MDQVLIAEIPESVRLPFLALSKFGLFSTNKLIVYIPITILVLMLASIVFIAMLQFLYIKKEISDIVRNLECVLGFSLVLLRMVIVAYRNKDFTRLIETIKLFWDPSICDQQTKLELISMRRFTYQLQRLLLLAISLAVGLVAVVSVVQNTIPTGMWTMEGHEKLYRLIGYVSRLILNYKFICFSRYYQAQARHVIIFTFVTLQIAFFCIPANHITNEALAVSDAVYFSKWYSQHIPHLKVPLLLMIQNSQNEITIKAGGLATINAGTIVNVLKVAWSVCSLVRGLREN
ncbi:hypothetical protein ILUMI_16177 [Ignelater luminosus]|uniref:Odorant receptor n=1 Tax=Ignelater luminosus TaxID=2038154 RepID=A0A8K0G8T4_IGNLU|nr:hypothetical protein ILUMI_16177 [Ignelater luminosus]